MAKNKCCNNNQDNNEYDNNNVNNNHTNSKTIVLPYHENFLDIKKPLKILGVRIAFSYSTIKNKLICNAPKGEGGVYKIECKDCSSVYIGQTGKTLEKRVKQHKYSVRTGQSNNAIFNHIFNNDHRMNWDCAKFIFKTKNFIERNVIQSAIISNIFNTNIKQSYSQF